MISTRDLLKKSISQLMNLRFATTKEVGLLGDIYTKIATGNELPDKDRNWLLAVGEKYGIYIEFPVESTDGS